MLQENGKGREDMSRQKFDGSWEMVNPLSSPLLTARGTPTKTTNSLSSRKVLVITTHTQERVLRYGITLSRTIWASYPKADMKKQDPSSIPLNN